MAIFAIILTEQSLLQTLGIYKPSFTSRLLEAGDPRFSPEEFDDLVLWTAGAVYAAGADTVSVQAPIFQSHINLFLTRLRLSRPSRRLYSP